MAPPPPHPPPLRGAIQYKVIVKQLLDRHAYSPHLYFTACLSLVSHTDKHAYTAHLYFTACHIISTSQVPQLDKLDFLQKLSL